MQRPVARRSMDIERHDHLRFLGFLSGRRDSATLLFSSPIATATPLRDLTT